MFQFTTLHTSKQTKLIQCEHPCLKVQTRNNWHEECAVSPEVGQQKEQNIP